MAAVGDNNNKTKMGCRSIGNTPKQMNRTDFFVYVLVTRRRRVTGVEARGRDSCIHNLAHLYLDSGLRKAEL